MVECERLKLIKYNNCLRRIRVIDTESILKYEIFAIELMVE